MNMKQAADRFMEALQDKADMNGYHQRRTRQIFEQGWMECRSQE